MGQMFDIVKTSPVLGAEVRGIDLSAPLGARDERPSSDHPMVRTHPETGRQALFVNSGFTTRINGLGRDEGRALLDFLFRHIDRHDFHHRFRWRPGSAAFWDNRSTQHLAVFDYWPQVRHGVRVTIEGDAPFYREETAPRRARAAS